MMTSLLLVDVQGFEALAKGQAKPAKLIEYLSESMPGLTRQVAVMRAYCSNRVSSYRRTAYREAGFEIIETNSPDETLILMTLDLADLSYGDATYEEAILLGGKTDYTALARVARERLMMVSVASHDDVPSSLEALADGLIDLNELDIDRSSTMSPNLRSRDAAPASPPKQTAPEPARETSDKPAQEKQGEDAQEGDAWPDPKTGTILVAGSGAAVASGVAAMSARSSNGVAPSPTPPVSAGENSANDKSVGEKQSAPASESSKAETAPSASDNPTQVGSEAASDGAETVATKADASKSDGAKPDETQADQGKAEPGKQAASKDTKEPSLDDDLAASIDEEIGAELEAELLADIAPASAAPAKPAPTPTSVPTENPVAQSASKNEAPVKVAETEAAKNIPPVEDDSSIDALFADLASAPASETPDQKVETSSVAPAVTAALMGDAKADADVDELLSRLMSDDLASESAGGKKAELDVVPER